MICKEFQERLMDVGRGGVDGEALQHALGCEACDRALLNQRALSTGLRAMASRETAAPSPELRRELLAHFDRPARPAGALLRFAIPAFVGAAAALLTWVFLVNQPRLAAPLQTGITQKPVGPEQGSPIDSNSGYVATMPRRKMRRIRPPRSLPSSPADRDAPFLPVPYAAPLLPTERAEIVRVNLSASALASLGITVWGADPEMRLNAEVVLGENGLARAVRVVQSGNVQ